MALPAGEKLSLPKQPCLDTAPGGKQCLVFTWLSLFPEGREGAQSSTHLSFNSRTG